MEMEIMDTTIDHTIVPILTDLVHTIITTSKAGHMLTMVDLTMDDEEGSEERW